MAHLYWLSVASKRLYAHAQGYSLYVVPSALQAQRHPVWDKFIALEAVLAHSCAEWVWITDADSWVMDTGFDAAAFAAQHASAHANATGVTPDVLLAHDCNGINAGSIFVRNTPWARQHLADAWFTDGPAVPNMGLWREQAALMYLSQRPAAAAHYGRVPQVLINAYASGGTCSDGSGDYTPGRSHLLHAPGNFKDALAHDSAILAPVLEAARLSLLHRHRPPVYALWPRNASAEGPGGSAAAGGLVAPRAADGGGRGGGDSPGHMLRERVVFKRSAEAGPSADAVDTVAFEVELQPRPPGAHNPAWPVPPLHWVHSLVRAWGAFAHAGPVAVPKRVRWRWLSGPRPSSPMVAAHEEQQQ